jgi:UDP-N-acetylglucosamine diphosphorylase/glucosamine-1-phosphate N-acetyltransferase
MNVILDDSQTQLTLLPLTFTRPASEIRVGILTIREKWEKHVKGSYSWNTQEYLVSKFPVTASDVNLIINGSVCPNEELLQAIDHLKDGECLVQGDILIAQKSSHTGFHVSNDIVKTSFEGTFNYINKSWQVFSCNAQEMDLDFELITKGRSSAELSSTNTVLGDRIFLEEGAEAECAIFNTKSGPVYLGKDSLVMEGSVVRGGLALCEHAQLKLASKIYGATTIGPHSKVGGEVNNSVIIGYSNKGHDGFLGNSVIGEWCNIGADSNNSNLKNNYDEVKLWSYEKGGFEKTGLQFCGLVMGDHSKCGINTMFNTGTVVGVSSNIFGAGFPRNFIPSFSWGGASGVTEYKFEKAMATAALVMKRRGIELDEVELGILQAIYNQTHEKG